MSTGKIDWGFRAQHVRHIRQQLGEQHKSVKIWGVVYTMSLGREHLAKCIQECDVINLWMWDAKDTTNLEQKGIRVENEYPDKPIVLGIYLWDYGGNRRMPLDLLEQQCELARKLALAGRIEGIVFLTINNDADAVQWTADWVRRVGDQKLPSPDDAADAGKQAQPADLWPQTFTDAIPGDEGSPWPTWIEGRNDTILMAYGAAGDGKVHVTRSSDGGYFSQSKDGVNWSAPVPFTDRVGEKVNMPLFYRIGDRWVLTYRLWNPVKSLSLSGLRISRNGTEWTEPILIWPASENCNNGTFLVRVKKQLIALNHRYPNRESIMRKVIDLDQLENAVKE